MWWNIYIYDVLFLSYDWVLSKAVGLQTIVVIVKHDYVYKKFPGGGH